MTKEKPAKKGHNSAGEELRRYIERVERLNEEIKDLGSDRTEVFAEAKGNGFDTAAMRRAIKRRAMEAADREEQKAMDDLYDT